MLEDIKECFKDITASNMEDLARTTNRKIDLKKRIIHEITVPPESKPIKQKTRGIPYNYRADFKATILEMKKVGMVIDSKSPWSSPIRLVKKKDGTIRICVDFRKVNAVTVKDAYPIPRIEDLFTYLGAAKIFSLLDLTKGYYQVKLDPASSPYTAFSCEFGFFEYTVMPMGLTNACATFQRLMNTVLDGLIGNICCVYLDDIIIFSKNVADHTSHVRLVADRLRTFNLKVNLKKCRFAQARVEYLSHIIGDGGIRPNPAKISAVSDFERPTTVKKVQSFLGLVSYYRKFIKNCAGHASPLIALTTKRTPFIWTQECELSFTFLKSALTSDSVLILPEFEQPFRIEADASKYGVGGVLSQLRDGHWRPVSYFSKHLSKTEVNYSASEREMLAIVLSVERFKQYVYGREFVILSDHQPLKFLLTADIPDARLARLMNRLLIFTYTIEYRAGKAHGNADALSRMVDEECFGELSVDEEQNVVINAIHLRSDINEEQMSDPNIKWIYDLKRANRLTGTAPAVSWDGMVLSETELKERKSLYAQWNRIYILGRNVYREYVDDDNILYQYVVPVQQRPLVLRLAHDAVCSGHLGTAKTVERIVPSLYWFRQLKDIKDYVRSCSTCQQVKSPFCGPKSPLKPIRTSRPSEIWTTDLMGPLPRTNGGNIHVLVVIDHFTKWVELFAMDSVTAPEVAKKLMLVFCRHGIPDTILSDQGTNYQSNLLSELYELLDVHKVRTSPYHPQTDGLSERFNRTIQAMLTSYIAENQQNWDLFLPTLAFAYNTAVHCTTKMTPFELVYGRKPKVPLDLIFKELNIELFLDPEGYAAQLKDGFNKAFGLVIINRDLSMDKNKVDYDRRVRAASFELTDLVWLLDTAKKIGKSSKLARKWTGPYEILARINQATYEIKPAHKKGRKKVVNQSRLKKCFTRDYESVVEISMNASGLDGDPVVRTTQNLGERSVVAYEDPNAQLDFEAPLEDIGSESPPSDIFIASEVVEIEPGPRDELVPTIVREFVPTLEVVLEESEERDPTFCPSKYHQAQSKATNVPTRVSSRTKTKPKRLGVED